MKIYLLCALLVFILPVNGQQNYSYKKKQTTQKGAIYFFWGYNRSVYSKSDIQFKGPGYDFTVSDATAHDNPSREFKTYINPSTLSVPQFNIRLGYYFKEKIDFSFGYDHMKYVMTDNQTALLSGTIEPSANSYLSGTYSNTPTLLVPKAIHYENSNGLNYVSAQLQRTNFFYRSKDRKHYLQYRYGFGLGGVITQTDFVWNNVSNNTKLKLSGFGGSVHTGLRADFFNRFFVQTNWTIGYINLPNLQTIALTENRAKQQFVYGDMQIVAGFFLYKRVKNGCSSCPDWD
ncbi:MAG: hypothetical protein R3279_02610 [Putridiphycobacter sp.]|nr:hypothetical protein [Putridiphycobacter sp.]